MKIIIIGLCYGIKQKAKDFATMTSAISSSLALLSLDKKESEDPSDL